MYFIFVLGPAGAGKSYISAALREWIADFNLDVIIVNLDPAADWLPYTPDVDIRDYITLEDVMKKYGLGPNGGLIMAVSLSADFVEDIRREIEEFKPNYVIVDTPGQLELFSFRGAGRIIMNALSGKDKVVALFLLDGSIIGNVSSFISMVLLAASVAAYHGFPQVTVINKADLLDRDSANRIMEWIEEPSTLQAELLSSRLWLNLPMDVIESIIRSVIPEPLMASANEYSGLDRLYAALQRYLAGGEDFLTEEPSEIL